MGQAETPPRPDLQAPERVWDEREHPGRGCPYCRDLLTDGDACGETEQGWSCTREPGHDGPHVACGGELHEMAEWGGPDG